MESSFIKSSSFIRCIVYQMRFSRGRVCPWRTFTDRRGVSRGMLLNAIDPRLWGKGWAEDDWGIAASGDEMYLRRSQPTTHDGARFKSFSMAVLGIISRMPRSHGLMNPQLTGLVNRCLFVIYCHLLETNGIVSLNWGGSRRGFERPKTDCDSNERQKYQKG
jgi:hypothetical protein